MKIKKRYIFLFILFTFQFLFENKLVNYSSTIEKYYSEGIYPIISETLRKIFGWLPFSISELFTLLFIIFILFNIYKLIKNRFKNIFSKLIKFLALVYIFNLIAFILFVLNAYREPLSEKLNIKEEKYSTVQLLKVTEKIIEKMNFYHSKIVVNDTIKPTIPYSNQQLFSIASNGFDNLAKKNHLFTYKNPSIKKSNTGNLLNYFRNQGITNGFFNEAIINISVNNTSIPATICHEIGHQIGWVKENEANFIGFLAAINNDDNYFKYSGYRMAFNYCISEIRKRDEKLYLECWRKVNIGVNKDFRESYLFWKSYDNPFEEYFDKIHDEALKNSNQPLGLESYNNVVKLLIAYYKVENDI